MLHRHLSFVFAILVLGIGFWHDQSPASALGNGLALTPPMGWNSWYAFRCGVSESLIKDQARALVKLGLRDVGYNTVVVDDCWAGERDGEGKLTTNGQFASGMPALANYLHNNRLKFGIYSSRGTQTCAGYPASQDHEQQDAHTFAEWGIDLIKYDNCPYSQDGDDMQRRYILMRDSILATGRPMLFSISMWEFKDWHPDTGHMSRTTGDIEDNWDVIMDRFYRNASYAGYAHPGYWNDPDVLYFGGAMSTTEYRSYFTLWAVSAAPLMISANLHALPAGTLKILTNREVIAFNQDPSGIQATHIADSAPGVTVWSKPLSTGEFAVVLLNQNAEDVEAPFDGGWLGLASYEVRDVWAAKRLGTISGVLTRTVPAHGVLLLRITPR